MRNRDQYSSVFSWPLHTVFSFIIALHSYINYLLPCIVFAAPIYPRSLLHMTSTPLYRLCIPIYPRTLLHIPSTPLYRLCTPIYPRTLLHIPSTPLYRLCSPIYPRALYIYPLLPCAFQYSFLFLWHFTYFLFFLVISLLIIL